MAAAVLVVLAGFLITLVFLPSEEHQALALAGRMARWVASWRVPHHWAFAVIAFDAKMVLFVPFGVLVPLVWGDLRGRVLVLTVVCAALLSVVIETLQMWIPSRVPTYSDVIANTLGGLCGVLVLAIIRVSRREQAVKGLDTV